MKKVSISGIIFLLAWLVFAQSCMFFRITDEEATRYFTEREVKAAIYYEDISNVPMHYVKTGSDSLPTLFFIHGSPGSWEAFKQYMQDGELLLKFRMVSVDRPGFGYSHFGHALNLGEQADIISIILKRLDNHKPVFLVGHSLGGPLCVKLAIDNPGMASGLVLLAAAIDPALEKPEKWRKLLMNNPIQYLVPGAFRPSNYELWYLKKDLELLKQEISTASLPFTWMIHGMKDQLVPYENVDFARKYFTAGKLDVISLSQSNHFIPWTNYNNIKKVLLQLLPPGGLIN